MTAAADIRHAILGATTVPIEAVPLPELGMSVKVRGMTGIERDAFEGSLVVQRGRKRDISTANLRAKLVAYCAVDDDGTRLFTDADAEQLGKVRGDLLNRLFTVAQRLSGLTDEDVDELGKDLSREASAGSSSASPGSSDSP